jgi:hypothetical protein
MADLPAPALPAASGYMNYTNDVTSIVGEVKGPNYLGEWMTAVSAVYAPVTNKTRVGFAIGVHGREAANLRAAIAAKAGAR